MVVLQLGESHVVQPNDGTEEPDGIPEELSQKTDLLTLQLKPSYNDGLSQDLMELIYGRNLKVLVPVHTRPHWNLMELDAVETRLWIGHTGLRTRHRFVALAA